MPTLPTRIAIVGFLFLLLLGQPVANRLVVAGPVQDPQADAKAGSDAGDPEMLPIDVATQVDVQPLNSDAQISSRLTEIYEATQWFDSISVRVDRGVVFLSGRTDTQSHQDWAEDTAMSTSDVVAVVNRIKLIDRPFWDFDPAWKSLTQLARETISILPLVFIAFAIAFLSYFLAKCAAAMTRWFTANRIDSGLLREVAGNAVGVLVFVIGMYIALRVSGLTRLAVTLLGGTGLVGLALGFAFRDIAENYLASILISLNHPFRIGDLIEVDGSRGFVRKVTTRGTVLSTIDGDQLQIPNSIVYKNKVQNFTATPMTRVSFTVGIGFEDSVSDAQRIIIGVLNQYSAVQKDPPPMVLVESLGSATVNLKGYYWVDQQQNSKLKVSSAIIRLVKQSLTDAGISMPDEAREIVFPNGVPVLMHDASASETEHVDGKSTGVSDESSAREKEVSEGEGNLSSEQDDLMRITEGDSVVGSEPNLLS